ncbi:Hint domain-containing protein [Acetobacter sp. UBA5411]|uniref:Hint domain-containing protein n=1 Tax=Acetobacter sp. UBA5411 TaxID=1945905 RepID=UPI0025B9C8A9|nr:Hint domain-containing protein [Acetobacter sp. UBA5411]
MAAAISGGDWLAVSHGGKTYYESGQTSVSDPTSLTDIASLVVASGAIVSGVTISGGKPVVSVLSGGILTQVTEMDGSLSVAAGGTVSSSTLTGDQASFASGAVAAGVTLGGDSSASVLSAVSGAIISGISVVSGGSLSLASGAVVNQVTASSGGGVSAASGTAINGMVLSSGSVNAIATFQSVTNYTDDTFDHTIPNATTGGADLWLPIDASTHVTSISIDLTIDALNGPGMHFFALQVDFSNGAWAHGGLQAQGETPWRINWGGLDVTPDDPTGYSINDPQDLSYIQDNIPQYVSADFLVGKTYTYTISRGEEVTFLPGYYTKIDGAQTYYVDQTRTMWEWHFTVTPTDGSSPAITQVLYTSSPYISEAAYWNENFEASQPASEWTNLKVTSEDGSTQVVSKVMSANATGPITSGSSITSGATILFSTTNVSSGQVLSHAQVETSGVINVENGGVTTGTIVGDGGSLLVSSGGIALQDTISSGGTAIALSSGTVERETVLSGGTIVVSSGGNAVSDILSGGSETVLSGAHVAWETLQSGAVLTVAESGMAGGAAISSGGREIVSSGGYVRGDTISAGGSVQVLSGGSATDETVLSGGTLTVSNGSVTQTTMKGGEFILEGGATHANVLSGGTLIVSSGTEFADIISSGGVVESLSGTLVEQDILLSGGQIILNGGKSYLNTVVGGTLTVSSGLAYYDTLSSGSTEIALSGANVQEETLLSGATLIVSSGALSLNNILSGGTEIVLSGSIIQSQKVLSGGTLIVSAGTASYDTISSGGTEKVQFGASAAAETVLSGATVVVSSGGSTLSNTLSGGTEVVLSGGVAQWQKVLSGGTLVLSNGASATNVSLASGGKIDFRALDYTSDVSASINSASNILTVSAGGKTTTVSLSDTYGDGPVTVTADEDGGVEVETCFLPDTLIRTPSGDVPVQSLRQGDLVLTYDWQNDRDVPQPLTWAGSQSARVRAGLLDDEAGYPVRILKDAIAPGQPYKDLLVTAEHCLFLKDSFIPARMLVNDRSIFYDRTLISYAYYHIETAEHSVVRADGLLTESYLDTGNRRNFTQNGSVVSFPAARGKSWENDAAAPLTVSCDKVEPVFRMIEARAEANGLTLRSARPAVTHDPDLHLRAENGMFIPVFRREGDWFLFMIPAGVDRIYLKSRAARPADVAGPFVDDRRWLGVLVGEIMVQDAEAMKPLVTHHQEVDLPGWHGLSDEPGRWTDGDAFLSLGMADTPDERLLSVQILAAGPYLVLEGKQAAALA